MVQPLRIGSRGSQLALWQARHVAELLCHGGRQAQPVEVSLVTITTSGDRILHAPLADFGGKGLFVKEIEDSLLAGKIDLAVHSLKDVPAQLAPGLELGAILPREDPRDALVATAGASLATLPLGARIGTSSLRRQAQLLAVRGDFQVTPLRGNVDTRLNKLRQSECDALMLAVAGLRRLGREVEISEYLPPERMLPAPGQGALALECRGDDHPLRARLQALHDPATAAAVTAERAVVRFLQAGCQAPLGAYAVTELGRIRLRALVASPDGRRLVRAEGEGSDPEAVGRRVGEELRRSGADEILQALAATSAAVPEIP